MQYECIRNFVIETYDENGFPTDKYMIIKKDSKWEIDKKSDIIGGEVHLDNVNGTQWIEISKEKLNKYFKVTTAINGKNRGLKR